jgi:glycine cleavage system transcriptional repressor
MNNHHYLLWATGEDKPGIVGALTGVLFRQGCNLEDSSMMRLGAEFGVLLIFSSSKDFLSRRTNDIFSTVAKKWNLSIGLKKISRRQAQSSVVAKNPFIIRVHGPDKPGIVFHVTGYLAKMKFNITDLSTHRTTGGKRPGYILFIEGEPYSRSSIVRLKKGLSHLQKTLNTTISLQSISASPL